MANTAPTRRRFLQATAATAAAGATLNLSASAAPVRARANDRLGVAFVGCGARGQAHINLVRKFAAAGVPIAPVGVCDVWDGLEDEFTQTFAGTKTLRHYAQGLYPSAKKCGFDPADTSRVCKDYRRLLDRADVDIVCISTPDHWHARMALDALAAGKDVLIEPPLARTPAEAQALVDAANATKQIVAVAAQNLTDPTWYHASELIRAGELGHLALVQAGVSRNDYRGQWRYYRLCPNMTPATVDWNLFLGHQFEVNGVRLGPTAKQLPFDRATFAQWRCHSAFSSGPISDLLTLPLMRLLAATGLRYPARVSASGGLFAEHDGRDVPDVVTLGADFAEGTHLQLTATTLSNYPPEELIRGRRGTLRFNANGLEFFADDPARTSRFPARADGKLVATQTTPTTAPKNETEAMWQQFLNCVRTRDCAPLGTIELGAATTTLLSMGWESCRSGMALAWDAGRREVRPASAGLPRFPRL